MRTLFLSILIIAMTACSGGNASGNNSARSVATADNNGIEHPEFNADSAYSFVERQVAFGPRVPGTKAHDNCADFISRSLRDFEADTVWHQTASVKAFNGKTLPIKNILASFNSGAKRRILILAHYDTRPWADQEEDKSRRDTPIDGANDGASGVGVMLELARAIGSNRPEVGVDMFFTDVEDYGAPDDAMSGEDTWCLGTQHWVSNLPYTPEERPAYGILLDMVGGTGAVFPREFSSSRMAPAVVDRVWGVAAASPYSDRFHNRIGGAIVDDHIYVNSAGIPCIDIIESANPATGGFPPTWHTLDDNMDHIDRSTLKAVGEVMLDVIYSEPGA